MIKFLSIYDDFIRAKKILSDEKIDISGLESIVKNMNSLLSEYGVSPINALGEIFDPNFHEAISVIEDSSLDDGTITKEIRKGYISQNRVIRPTIVEISKKLKLDNSMDEQND
jgi:molecular chaperone GrpE